MVSLSRTDLDLLEGGGVGRKINKFSDLSFYPLQFFPPLSTSVQSSSVQSLSRVRLFVTP